jgi:hypothetical protein
VQAIRSRQDGRVARDPKLHRHGVHASSRRRRVYVTTATYTAPARELAKRHAIELVDGDRLSELLLEHCAEEESDDAIVANTFAIAASGLLTSGEVLEIAPDATASVVAIGAPRECSCGAQMEWHNDRAPRWDCSTCGEVIGRSDVAVDDPPGSKAFNDFVIALNAGDFLRAAEMFAVNAAVTSLSGPVTALRTPTDAERWVATFPVILDPVVASVLGGRNRPGERHGGSRRGKDHSSVHQRCLVTCNRSATDHPATPQRDRLRAAMAREIRRPLKYATTRRRTTVCDMETNKDLR